jgi:hypothetical protein
VALHFGDQTKILLMEKQRVEVCLTDEDAEAILESNALPNKGQNVGVV